MLILRNKIGIYASNRLKMVVPRRKFDLRLAAIFFAINEINVHCIVFYPSKKGGLKIRSLLLKLDK